jgi:glycosyltransferase involved in cell wall biosynthesis
MNRIGENRSEAPWLTVVIPSYCGEQWVDASFNSLVSEDMEGVEILLIDGSPTRETVDLAKKFSHRLRLRIFDRPDLLSWHSKTNFGVEMAESTHICWLGVDDIWLPGRIAAARSWINAAPLSPLHLAPSAVIDKGGRKLGVWRCPLPANTELRWPFVNMRLLVQNFVAAPAPVFRKDAWMRCGGLDEQLWYTADWDIWLKLSEIGPVYYHDAVTIGFRIHGGSLTMTGSRDIADFARQMQTVLDRHLPQLQIDSQTINRTARASITVNCALAAASAGDLRGLPRAAFQLLGLGPTGIARYLRDSRILDRVLPRIRAKFSGVF